MAEIHLPDTDYMKLVAALLAVEPCPFSGVVTENEIKIVLGEHGDIWPDAMRASTIADAFEGKGGT